MHRSGPTGVHIAFLVAALGAAVFVFRHFHGEAMPSRVVVASAVVLYVLSHVLRFVRLRVLLIEMRLGFRHLLWTHFETAWVGALLPFRLGELFRVIRLSEVTESWRDGVAAYVVEKFFDGAFLLVIVVGVIGLERASGELSLLAVTLAFVAGGALFVYWSLPGSIGYLASLLLGGRSQRSLVSLRLLDQIRELYGAVVSKVHQRSLPLFGLTVLIWAIDLSAYGLLVGGGALGDRLRGFLRALEGTLGAVRGERLGAYAVMVVASLTLLASSVALLRIVSGDWSRPRNRVAPYRLTFRRKRMGHG